jgi:hypothetical protein
VTFESAEQATSAGRLQRSPACHEAIGVIEEVREPDESYVDRHRTPLLGFQNPRRDI